MLILLAFVFLAGLVTVFSPCIWPILPVLLAATVAGGRRRPLGIVTGLALAFIFATLILSSLAASLPVAPAGLRSFGIVIIVLFALVLIFPPAERLFERCTRRLAAYGNRFTGRSGEGFLGGLMVGAALGLVWSPCAGPILGTVASLVATETGLYAALLLTLAFVVGMAVPLYLLTLFGQRILGRTRALARYTPLIRRLFGLLMLFAAWLLATGYDAVIMAKLTGTYPVCGPILNTLDQNQAFLRALEAWRSR